MKSQWLLLALFLSAPAVAAERNYSLTDFDRVRIEGPYQVRLTTGLATGGSASGSQQALEAVSVEVQGSTLRVRPNRSTWGGYPGQSSGPPPVITLRTRNQRAASVSGSGSLAIDKARGLQLDLALAGSGRLSVGALDTDRLTIAMLGSGKMSLAGKAKQLKATIQGSAELDAQGLRADELQLGAETAGPIRLAAGRSAKVKNSGAGDVTIAGSAACSVEALGTGTVRCGNGVR
jgi:hypothetical protein